MKEEWKKNVLLKLAWMVREMSRLYSFVGIDNCNSKAGWELIVVPLCTEKKRQQNFLPALPTFGSEEILFYVKKRLIFFLVIHNLKIRWKEKEGKKWGLI